MVGYFRGANFREKLRCRLEVIFVVLNFVAIRSRASANHMSGNFHEL